MVFKFMTFDPDDEYLNNHPGSPPYYYDPCPSFSSSDSSSADGVCNGCLGGISSGLVLPVAETLHAGQQFSSPVQVPQSQNRGRDGNNNFLLKLINRRRRYHLKKEDDSKVDGKLVYHLKKEDDSKVDGELVYHFKKEDDSKVDGKLVYHLKKEDDSKVDGELVLCDGGSWTLFGLEDLLRASAKVLPKVLPESPQGRYNTSLEELLRASAEGPGGGSRWSTTYKVCFEDLTTVVVKRLKNGKVTMTKLREHMELLGQIRHENVAPLRGYLISRKESLMLYDYYSQLSVHAMLQGRKSYFYLEMPSSSNWEKRLKIVIGAVRGIAYIHSQNGGKLFHGNLTSSNVFINPQGYGCVADICCNTLKSGESPYSRYNLDTRGASQKSDIYGLGLLMLELLFGDIPLEACGVFSDEYYDKTDDIYNFDEELSYWKCMPMLKLALRCMTMEIGKRSDIEEVVEIAENIYIQTS